ncbi:hypothetical protein [Nitrincola lacisaponensis]|uniref:hypothetical protein n=1 Tax=Nitrincola lacisaponensis TaxID=267850 RepID=UPI00055C14C5|nr:hypothetical protein [Nitrincola lacisaponensis]
MSKDKRLTILAVASKGGHWLQLLRLRHVWHDQNVIYMSNDKSLSHYIPNEKMLTVPDASMDKKVMLIYMALVIAVKIVWYRPDVIISTGAAPGFFALVIGKVLRKKTIWVDSIANAEAMSLSGQKVKPFADLWMTQWKDVSSPDGPIYRGEVF